MNTGTLGGCGLRGGPRAGGRSSTRGGAVPFAPGRGGGGLESKRGGLLDVVKGVGGSGRVWMLFCGSRAFSTSTHSKGIAHLLYTLYVQRHMHMHIGIER